MIRRTSELHVASPRDRSIKRPHAAILFVIVSCGGQSGPATVNPAGTGGAGVAGVGGSGDAGGSAGTAQVAGASAGAPAAASGSGGSATAGAPDPGTAIPANFETVKLVFGGGGGVMPCSAAPCHGVNGVAPPDDPLELPPMNDSQLYANLTTYVSRACGNTKLVSPGNPAQSALVTILRGPCGMTPRMPYGCSAEAGDCIPEEYIAAVARWIADGAPPP